MPLAGDEVGCQLQMTRAAANELSRGDPVLGRIAEARYTVLADADDGESRR